MPPHSSLPEEETFFTALKSRKGLVDLDGLQGEPATNVAKALGSERVQLGHTAFQ